MWSRIRTLPGCPALPVGEGRADLRLTFEAGRTELAFHPPATTLDTDAVASCLGEGLRRLETQIEAAVLVVSFRFELTRPR